MSDHCYVNISVWEHNAADLCEILCAEPETTQSFGSNGWVQLEFSDCPEALEEERRTATKEGIRFYGWHFAGDSYPAAMFASNGDGQLYQVLALDRPSDIWPVVKITLYGELDDLVRARDALTIYRDVQSAAIGNKEPADFSEQLKVSLDDHDNAGVIDDLDLHDPRNIGLLLDYIRMKRGGNDRGL